MIDEIALMPQARV
jgi:hypothetical protein